jgi:hypothetical protein
MRAKSVTDVILGEAVSGSPEKRYEDMKAIASVMVNRARSLGVPLETVVQNQREFNAYNKRLPSGVNAYRGLAEQALNEVITNGPVHNATFYATPAAKGNLPKGLVEETRTGGHVYFSDPKNRAIGTAVGYRRPDPVAAAQYAGINENNVPVPSAAPRGLLGEPSFPATQAAVQRGGLLDAPVEAASFDMGRFGDPAPAQAASFDMGRFGPRAEPVQAFDEGRFGRQTNMNYQNLVDANRATRPQPAQAPQVAQFDSGRFGTATTQPQGIDGLREGLLASNAQLAAPQGILNTAAAAQPSVQAAAKTNRLAAAGPASFQGPVMPGMQPAMDAANLQLDVMDQRAKMGLPPVNQPAVQPAYVDPMVTTAAPARASPAVASPAMGGGLLSADGPMTGGFGPSMTIEDADRMKRSLQMRTLGGGVLGGLLGGAVLGPVGALAGGYFGRNLGAKSYFPDAPKKSNNSENKGYGRDSLSSEGRDAAGRSKQFDKAVSSGKGGLW